MPPPDKKTIARNAPAQQTRKGRASPSANTRPSSVKDLLSHRSALAALTAQIPRQQSWTEWLRVQLPEPLGGHLVNVVERADELVVFADSAVWGTRLRYALAALAADIAQRAPAIRRSSVRVGAAGG